MLTPNSPAPLDPTTGEPVEKAGERIALLISELSRAKTKIILPTPALSEFFIKAGAALSEYHRRLRSMTAFRIAPFDEKAAIECALMNSAAIASGDKRAGIQAEWQKVKFDRQILAIARAEGASKLYTDDLKLQQQASAYGVEVAGIADLPLPQEDRQRPLF